MLAAGAIGDLNPVVELAAAIMGGGLAASTHATKAGSRVLINTSPEPFSNWIASISEDVVVITGVWACINHPVLFLIALAGIILLMIWFLPRIWGGVQKVFGFIINLFKKETPPSGQNPSH
jgi:sterol desaturase/sphingolipid hydroxylase (fatty acid hydroxylase superfamily)